MFTTGAFVTVTNVRVSPDLGVARVYLSFLAVKDKDGLLDTIREKGKIIRQHLGDRVRHQLRIVPELNFFLDDTAEYAEKNGKASSPASKFHLLPQTRTKTNSQF